LPGIACLDIALKTIFLSAFLNSAYLFLDYTHFCYRIILAHQKTLIKEIEASIAKADALIKAMAKE